LRRNAVKTVVLGVNKKTTLKEDTEIAKMPIMLPPGQDNSRTEQPSFLLGAIDQDLESIELAVALC